MAVRLQGRYQWCAQTQRYRLYSPSARRAPRRLRRLEVEERRPLHLQARQQARGRSEVLQVAPQWQRRRGQSRQWRRKIPPRWAMACRRHLALGCAQRQEHLQ